MLEPAKTALYVPVLTEIKDCDSRLPNHITILFPFLNKNQITQTVTQKLQDIAKNTTQTNTVFEKLQVFPSQHVVMLPKNIDYFMALINTISNQFNITPYNGMFETIVPHMTVANMVQSKQKERVIEKYENFLPVTGTVCELVLCETTGKPYPTLNRFKLNHDS